MRVHFILPSLVLLATTAFSSPSAPKGHWADWAPNQNHNCLSNATVDTIVSGYTLILENPTSPDFNTTANAILSPALQIQSDSINTLANRPLGGLSFPPGLEPFIASSAQTPPLPGIQTQGVFYNCRDIAWRWVATGLGSTQYPVQGQIQFVVGDDLKVTNVYSEFNTAAFIRDLGGSCPSPTQQ